LLHFPAVAPPPRAVIVVWTLARDLSGSARAATIAALLVACSPMLVIYGGQGMTDVPSVFFTATALVIHLRGLRRRRIWLILIGAAVLGLGGNLRGNVRFFFPRLVPPPPSRHLVFRPPCS